MNNSSREYRRRIRYIDPLIQRRVIVGLVLFELCLVVGGIIYLHGAFRELIEQNLYSIHLQESNDLWSMMSLVLAVSAAIFAINIPVVIMLMGVWERNLGKILGPYRQALSNLSLLNFRFAFNEAEKHPLLDGVRAFFEKERQDHTLIRSRLKAIEQSIKHIENGASDGDLKAQISELRSYVGNKNG
jgi:hypothetical protein